MKRKGSENGLENPKKVKAKGPPKAFNFALHPRRKIAFSFLYFGWEHDGLVMQKNTDNTVEQYIRDALLKTRLIESWETCDFSRCGRTDKGVSAFRQVAACVVRSSDVSGKHVFWPEGTDQETIDAFQGNINGELPFVRMLNGCLPNTIQVYSWAPVAADFSARHACNQRVYKYSLPKARLDVAKMREAAQLLVGTHDFRNFCQVDMNEARVQMSYIRELFEVRIDQVSSNPRDEYSLLELTVRGSGFLWHQIRFFVGILYDIGLGNEQPQLITDLLDVERNPRRPQYNLASDTPLCLFDCKYDSVDLEWREDEQRMQHTVGRLQKEWAAMTTRARMLENMLEELTSSDAGRRVDISRGLNEFTQDRPQPPVHIPYLERKMCASLEEKKQRLEEKKQEKERNGAAGGTGVEEGAVMEK